MKILFSLILVVSLVVNCLAQVLSATSILQDSERRVETLEERANNLSGTVKTTVNFSSDVFGRKAKGKSSYRIFVKDGLDAKAELIGTPAFSDSMVSKMMERESSRRLNKPIMRVFDLAFPWEMLLGSADKKQEFSTKLISDTISMSGRNCYLISFEMDAEGDSLSAEGKGEIWIDTATLLPIRTSRDFTMNTSRGKAEVKTFSDFTLLQNGIPVLLRSEIQTIPKFLFVSIGLIRIVIEQSDFNLE